MASGSTAISSHEGKDPEPTRPRVDFTG
jgi:hypothetical protein